MLLLFAVGSALADEPAGEPNPYDEPAGESNPHGPPGAPGVGASGETAGVGGPEAGVAEAEAGEAEGEEEPIDPNAVRFLIEIVVGGAGNLYGDVEGSDLTFALLGRPSFVWPWGMWLYFEVGQEHMEETRADRNVTLDITPIRLGLGASVPVEMVDIRVAVQAAAQRWWVGGARPVEGWRTGAGLVLGASYRIASCCVVGAEVGMDFLPRAVQIEYDGEPLFGLDPWRWRAGAWFGFDVAAL